MGPIYNMQRLAYRSLSTMSGVGKKIVVFGGNGFLGKRICEAAVNRGYDVTSVSSSGSKPKKLSIREDDWVSKVSWQKADVFDKESYQDLIKDATGVVHSIGILLENTNYKKVVNSNEGMMKSYLKTSNPMDKDVSKTYEKVNYESAVVLGEALKDCNPNNPAMCYISADVSFPGLPSGYLDSKRKAEAALEKLQPGIRPISVRPGFMYDAYADSDPSLKDFRHRMKGPIGILSAVNERLLGSSIPFAKPPISTQQVAKWVVDKIEDPQFHGYVSLGEMKGKFNSCSAH